MKSILKGFAFVCTLFALSLLASPVGHCSETSTLDQQVTALMTDFRELKNDNLNLQTSLETSKNQLTIAKQQLIVSDSQVTDLQADLIESKNQQMELQKQIATLEQQLTQLKTQTSQAQNTQEIANKELSQLSSDLKTLEKQSEKLKSQNNMLKGGILGLVVYAVFK